jgi:hypothetical protein
MRQPQRIVGIVDDAAMILPSLAFGRVTHQAGIAVSMGSRGQPLYLAAATTGQDKRTVRTHSVAAERGL